METKWCWAFPAHSRPPKPIGLSQAQQSLALPPSGRTCTPAQCVGWMRQGWAHIQHSLVIWQVLVEKQMEKAEDTQFPKFLFRRLYPPQPPLNLWVSSDSLNPSSKFLPLGAQEKRASICKNYRSRSVVVLGCVCVPVKCWLLAGELRIEVSSFRDVLLEAGTLQEVSVQSVTLESKSLAVLAAHWPLWTWGLETVLAAWGCTENEVKRCCQWHAWHKAKWRLREWQGLWLSGTPRTQLAMTP